MEKKFDFDDILIQPAKFSEIRSRKTINVRDLYGYLPLMTAPMDTVIDENNLDIFKQNKIHPVLPRQKDPNEIFYDDCFHSYGIDDFVNTFLYKDVVNTINGKPLKVLIDIANGHLMELYNISKEAKNKYGDRLTLMIGNVANPETFFEYCEIGVDMVRIGIGNGGGCLTTVQTGIGYPLASLISECFTIKRYRHKTKIVADGGFKKYSDIIKALGLGADYVMLGSIFNKCLESAGETTNEFGEVVDQYDIHTLNLFSVDAPFYKTFRGMSTKEVQRKWGKEVLTTSEGIVTKQKVEYTLPQWCDNFESYLRSAMSYSGKEVLIDFIGNIEFNLISENAFKRFNK